MNFAELEKVDLQSQRLGGGKALTLAQLMQAGLPVPAGLIVQELPWDEQEWQQIFQWWRDQGGTPLAVRSSAHGEDSQEFSFAGQFLSFLNIETETELREAVHNCFKSIDREAGLEYQAHFGYQAAKMNVLVQAMVLPKFSGVYFSRDPREKDAGWLLEIVEGYGEALVSGQVSPFRFSENRINDDHPQGWQPEFTRQIIEYGRRVEKLMGYDVDMELAVDQSGKVWVLQARPITAAQSSSSHRRVIEAELNFLKQTHGPETLWDGQTFAEYSGAISELTFAVWQKAFSKKGAFGKALQEVGYLGAIDGDPLLERVFGRAYVNLSRLEHVFFGRIPYSFRADPRPHLKFNRCKIDLPMILRTPISITRMMRVAWNLQANRSHYIDSARDKLGKLQKHANLHTVNPKSFRRYSEKMLVEELNRQVKAFSEEKLKWPFVLILLIESTVQTLTAILKKEFGHDNAGHMIQEYMAGGLRTVTVKMYQDFLDSAKSDNHDFIFKYGHRGPGELDLSSPRWAEFAPEVLAKKLQVTPTQKSKMNKINVNAVSVLHRAVFEQELGNLHSLLELRENWKMHVMWQYAVIRWLALELGRRHGIDNDVFWLTLNEIQDVGQFKQNILGRRQRMHIFESLSFPAVVSLADLEHAITGSGTANESVIEGEGISPGLAYGTAVTVRSIEKLDYDSLPDDAVIVAESTDPAWTPVFHRAKAIIVSRGGVLSHCAIVAREMGIPVVSRVTNCTNRIKDGSHVWVDGTNGHIKLA